MPTSAPKAAFIEAFERGIGDSMKAHVSEIMRKLGVRNRTQVALYASALDFDRVGL